MRPINKHSLAQAAGISTFMLFALALSGCAHDELREARNAAADADFRAAQAAHAASLSQKNAQEANFARFEADSRADQAERDRKAAETRARILEESQFRPFSGSYEHYKYRSGDGSYTESYESW